MLQKKMGSRQKNKMKQLILNVIQTKSPLTVSIIIGEKINFTDLFCESCNQMSKHFLQFSAGGDDEHKTDDKGKDVKPITLPKGSLKATPPNDKTGNPAPHPPEPKPKVDPECEK